jgi:quercetin dioxygenase-like cupin family protein
VTIEPKHNPNPGQAFSRIELRELFNIAQQQHLIPWKPFQEGVEIHRLYGDGVTGPSAALLRFRDGGEVPLHTHAGYEHIFILSGSQRDDNNVANAGTLLINLPGTTHRVVSDGGCFALAIYEKPVVIAETATAPLVTSPVESILLAVNGTLMRGLELNPNLQAVGAKFTSATTTAPRYRLWSIEDRFPGMLRSAQGGQEIQCELWAVPPAGLASVLLREPAGLTIGKVELSDGREVLGVLAEPWLCEHRREITAFGGWREYVSPTFATGGYLRA